jgi:hypothetical protein
MNNNNNNKKCHLAQLNIGIYKTDEYFPDIKESHNCNDNNNSSNNNDSKRSKIKIHNSRECPLFEFRYECTIIIKQEQSLLPKDYVTSITHYRDVINNNLLDDITIDDNIFDLNDLYNIIKSGSLSLLKHAIVCQNKKEKILDNYDFILTAIRYNCHCSLDYMLECRLNSNQNNYSYLIEYCCKSSKLIDIYILSLYEGNIHPKLQNNAEFNTIAKDAVVYNKPIIIDRKFMLPAEIDYKEIRNNTHDIYIASKIIDLLPRDFNVTIGTITENDNIDNTKSILMINRTKYVIQIVAHIVYFNLITIKCPSFEIKLNVYASVIPPPLLNSRCKIMTWGIQRLLWIGHMKNHPEECDIAKLPSDIIRIIIRSIKL